MVFGVRWPFRRTPAAEAAATAPAAATPAESTNAMSPRPAGPPPLDAGFATAFRARADARDATTVLGAWGGLGETARFAVSATNFANDAFVTQRWSDDIVGRAEPLVAPDTDFVAGLATLASYRDPSGEPGDDGSVFGDTLPVAGAGVFAASGGGAAPSAIARTPSTGRTPMRASAAAIEAAIRAAEGTSSGAFAATPRAASRAPQPGATPPAAAAPRGIARTADTATTTSAPATTPGGRPRSRISEPPSSRDSAIPPVALPPVAPAPEATGAAPLGPAGGVPDLPLATDALAGDDATPAVAATPPAMVTPAPLAVDRDPPIAAEPPPPAAATPDTPPLPLVASPTAEGGHDAVPATADAVQRAIAAAEAPSPGATTPDTHGPSSTTGPRDTASPAGASGTIAAPPAGPGAAGAPPSSSAPSMTSADTPSPLGDPPASDPAAPGDTPSSTGETLPLANPPAATGGGDTAATGAAATRAGAVQRAIAAAEAPATPSATASGTVPGPGALAARTVTPPLGTTDPDAAPPRAARPHRFAIGEPVAADLPFARPPLSATATPGAPAPTIARGITPTMNVSRTVTPGSAGPTAPLVLARATPAESPAATPLLSPQSSALSTQDAAPLFRVADDAPLPVEPLVTSAGPPVGAQRALAVQSASAGGSVQSSAPGSVAASVQSSAPGGGGTGVPWPTATAGAAPLPFATPPPSPFDTVAAVPEGAMPATFAPGATPTGGAMPLQRFVAPSSPVVQRVTSEAEPLAGEVPAMGMIGPAGEAGAAPSEPDLDRLTEKVWQRIRRTLQLERERRRGLP